MVFQRGTKKPSHGNGVMGPFKRHCTQRGAYATHHGDAQRQRRVKSAPQHAQPLLRTCDGAIVVATSHWVLSALCASRTLWMMFVRVLKTPGLAAAT